jgi:Tfp pilus assembly protein PilF
LNGLGYRLLGLKQVDAAIEVFHLNVEAYPESSNAYDSLAEAYMVHGDNALAVKNYRKSRDLNFKNTNAVERLKKLAE